MSGTPGAAHVFSESYLYTAEAVDLYLSRLAPEGVLNVMRPESTPPREMLRLLATVVESLRRRGIERPAEHVMVLVDRRGSFVAVLAQPRPFAAEQVQRVAAWAGSNPTLALAAAPGFVPSGPSAYAALLAAPTARDLDAGLRRYPWDVRPVTDDRPFFFRTSRWSHLWPQAGVDTGAPIMELGLLTLLGISAAAALVLVYLPLRGLRRQGGTGAARLVAFFGSLGLGYMAIEMALIQKFGLLLGHPNLALSVVLAALLLATGVGSLLSELVVKALGGSLRFVSYALSFVLLAELLLVFPRLGLWMALPLAGRVGAGRGARGADRASPRHVLPDGARAAQAGVARARAVGLGTQRHGLRRRPHPRGGGVDDGGHHRPLPRRGAGLPARRLRGAQLRPTTVISTVRERPSAGCHCTRIGLW